MCHTALTLGAMPLWFQCYMTLTAMLYLYPFSTSYLGAISWYIIHTVLIAMLTWKSQVCCLRVHIHHTHYCSYICIHVHSHTHTYTHTHAHTRTHTHTHAHTRAHNTCTYTHTHAHTRTHTHMHAQSHHAYWPDNQGFWDGHFIPSGTQCLHKWMPLAVVGYSCTILERQFLFHSGLRRGSRRALLTE